MPDDEGKAEADSLWLEIPWLFRLSLENVDPLALINIHNELF